MIVRAAKIVEINFSIAIIATIAYSTVAFSLSGALPEIASYARVSKNGDVRANSTIHNIETGRGFRDFEISRSPVYVPTKIANLRKGEAVDHPSTVGYSTLDREAVAKLDVRNNGQRAQDRFHPPASFERVVAHGNDDRMKKTSVGDGKGSKDANVVAFPVPDYATLPRDAYTSNYDYQTDSKTINGPPSSGANDDSGHDFSKIPDTYEQPETYGIDSIDDAPKFSDFSSDSYPEKYPVKPVEQFSNVHDRPTFTDDTYPIYHDLHHDDHDYHHDFVYENPPDDHYHHRPITTTTEEPEMNDQRLSKRPYSYYYIGKKLWYLPLYFSIYFIIYIAALVLKSITRHKINFPASLAAVAGDARHDGRSENPSWLGLTRKVLDGIDAYNAIGKTIGSSKS